MGKIFGIIALLFLTLFGYSLGAVVASRPRRTAPALLDLLVLLVLWVGVVVLREFMGKWTAFLMAWGAGALAGALLSVVNRRPVRGSSGEGQSTMLREIGNFESRMIIGILYFVAVTPVAAFARLLLGDPLRLRARTSETAWLPRPQKPATLDEARRQF